MRRLFFPIIAFLWCLVPAAAMAPSQVATVTPAWQEAGWSGFTPNSLLAAYWRANTPSAGAVSSWADDIGSFALTQATGGSQPVQAATTCNGTPGVTFDGTDDNLRAGATTGLPTGSTEGWEFVFNVVGVNDANIRVPFSYGAQSASARRTVFKSNKTTFPTQQLFVGDQTATIQATGSSELGTGPHVFVGHWTGSLVEGWLDGAPLSIPSVSASTNTSTTRTSIGADLSATPASFWQGVICDVAVRSGSLTTKQRQQIEAYFAWLRLAPYILPPNHPYRWRKP